jgi:hypothetical protein
MIRTRALTTALLVAASGSFADVHVVPTAYQAVPGGGTFLGPLANAARTYQLLIHSDQLAPLVGAELTGVTFRLLPSAANPWPAATINFANYDIRLSGSVAPADRSLTFAGNVVGTQTLVRSGPLEIPAASFPNGASPNAFGTVITFTQPYTYTGGHLLVEIRHTGFTGTSSSVDAIAASSVGTGYGTEFSGCWTGSYVGTSGSQGNFSVLQFTKTGGGAPCYANCDASTGSPSLTANDFQCFLNSFAAGESYADCDAVGGLTANDFQCFLNAYAAGCS